MQAGYTVVELLMATSIFAVGVTGVVAMEVSTVDANAHARNVAVATALARSWQDKLAMDATLWGEGGNWSSATNNFGLNLTTWIQTGLTNDGTWILPAADATNTFGPGANTLGGYEPTAPFFCTHIRLTQLIPTQGSGLVRAEVRVFWPTGPVAYNGDYCSAAEVANVGASFIGAAPGAGAMSPTPVTTAQGQFHFVYKTSALRETPAF